MLFYTEKGGAREDDFQSMWHACWFANPITLPLPLPLPLLLPLTRFVVVTLTTVGYGDVTPATVAGKFTTAVAILCSGAL